MRRFSFVIQGLPLLLCATALSQTTTYDGPRPPKADIPYLLHADNLVETETTEAKQTETSNDTIYTVTGPSSTARTPLAEPIFLIQTEKIAAEKLELYRLEVKDGNRRIVFPKKRRRDSPRPLRLTVTRLAEGLFRVEANEGLENGEYSLTPAGSNQVFCFQVY